MQHEHEGHTKGPARGVQPCVQADTSLNNCRRRERPTNAAHRVRHPAFAQPYFRIATVGVSRVELRRARQARGVASGRIGVFFCRGILFPCVRCPYCYWGRGVGEGSDRDRGRDTGGSALHDNDTVAVFPILGFWRVAPLALRSPQRSTRFGPRDTMVHTGFPIRRVTRDLVVVRRSAQVTSDLQPSTVQHLHLHLSLAAPGRAYTSPLCRQHAFYTLYPAERCSNRIPDPQDRTISGLNWSPTGLSLCCDEAVVARRRTDGSPVRRLFH